MTEHQIILQYPTEFIARHLVHDDIAEYQIRLHLFQVCQRLFCRISVYHLIVGSKDMTQILCHIHIIIHHQNLRSIHVLALFGLCFHRTISTQRNLHHPLLLFRNFHLIIYRPVHRQTESEFHTIPERSLSRGFAHLMHILHHDRTMMKLHKALYIIKSDARTPTVKIRILRICQLVISLEHILQLILLYRLSAVKD